MPNSNPKILVLGAAGQVGKGVVENLKNDPNVEVIAAARSPEKAASLVRRWYLPAVGSWRARVVLHLWRRDADGGWP